MLHSIRQFIEALQRSLWADPHTGRNRSVPFFGRRTPALGRQQRGGFQNPLRRPVQNAQMLHTAYGASRSDLSRETPAARALRLAGRRAGRVVRRGHRRLDRRDHALRSVMRGAGSGDKAHLSNLARQFDRLALELLESDWAHGDLKPENILLDESGTLRPVDFDAMFLPVFAGEKSPELGTAAYQHPGRTAEDFDASIDDYSIATISTTLHALALEPGLLARYNRGEGLLLSPRKIVRHGCAAHAECLALFEKGGRRRPLSHRPGAQIPADAPAELEAARPIRRLRARNSGRPGRTLRPGRTVGFQNRRTGIDPTHIRRRFRLLRRLGRRPHGTLLAFHRLHRGRSDQLFGLQRGKTVRKRPGDRRPRRTTSGHRPQGTPNHLAYLTANNYLYPKNTCSDRVVSRESEK